jgi:hypothetical protein
MSQQQIDRILAGMVVVSSVLHALIFTHPDPGRLLAAFLEQRQLAEDLAINSIAGETSLQDIKGQFDAYEKMVRGVQSNLP